MITNRFAELSATNNKISVRTMTNVVAVANHLNGADLYNLAAHAFMEIAYDMHMHGTALENAFAEEIVAGVAQGLQVEAEETKRYPKCPSCGRRHRR